MLEDHILNNQLVINFMYMNQEKFNNIFSVFESLNLKFNNKRNKLNIQLYFSYLKTITTYSHILNIYSPLLNIYSIDENQLIVHISEDNNELQYFIKFIKRLEDKINYLYNLKKKFHSSISSINKNYIFNSNFISNDKGQYFLRLSINPQKVKIDNTNQITKINKVKKLEGSHCNLFLEVKNIWEKDKLFGYYLLVTKIDRSRSHLIPNYSFVSSDSENESQDEMLLFGDSITYDNLSTESEE